METKALKRYRSVRWTWWKNYNLTELREAFKDFDLTILNRPKSWITLHPSHMLEANADTLYVWLSAVKAGLFQKQGGTFTEKDKELKEVVFKLYPHWRSTPFSFNAPTEYWI